jgi:hypothetical protein
MLAARVPGLDVDSPSVREAIQPLARPAEGVSPGEAVAVRDASTEAFHLAMLTSVVLLVLGAAANGMGISNRQALSVAGGADPHAPPPAEASAAG